MTADAGRLVPVEHVAIGVDPLPGPVEGVGRAVGLQPPHHRPLLDRPAAGDVAEVVLLLEHHRPDRERIEPILVGRERGRAGEDADGVEVVVAAAPTVANLDVRARVVGREVRLDPGVVVCVVAGAAGQAEGQQPTKQDRAGSDHSITMVRITPLPVSDTTSLPLAHSMPNGRLSRASSGGPPSPAKPLTPHWPTAVRIVPSVSIARTQWLRTSVKYRVPSSASARSTGKLSLASVAGPPSPE